jgi:hypothetical protein
LFFIKFTPFHAENLPPADFPVYFGIKNSLAKRKATIQHISIADRSPGFAYRQEGTNELSDLYGTNLGYYISKVSKKQYKFFRSI